MGPEVSLRYWGLDCQVGEDLLYCGLKGPRHGGPRIPLTSASANYLSSGAAASAAVDLVQLFRDKQDAGS